MTVPTKLTFEGYVYDSDDSSHINAMLPEQNSFWGSAECSAVYIFG